MFCGWEGKRGMVCVWVAGRDRPKPILLVWAVAETAAETRDTYTAVTKPSAECQGVVSAETVAETQKQSSYDVFIIIIHILKVKLLSKSNLHIIA